MMTVIVVLTFLTAFFGIVSAIFLARLLRGARPGPETAEKPATTAREGWKPKSGENADPWIQRIPLRGLDSIKI